ncbi:hypothetical protein [Aquimarina macrocephali]|uniref:hypothetical protein n=1 Tax=Aquimarina macrocephali TaxID=666563 RepID=UPI0004658BEE|nr:hypothetical protein [Aquimarina macrocephali]
MEDYKGELKILIEELDAWYKKIIKSSGGLNHFTKWLDENGITGIKRSSIEGCRKILKDQEISPLVSSFIFNSDSNVGKAKTIIRFAKKYFQSLKHPFEDRIWFFYFLDIGSSKYDKYPKIGRGLLKTHSEFNAALENVPDGFSQNYEGKYRSINDNVIFFDLNTPDERKRLHLKICFHSIENEIMLGTYSTFDRLRVLSGSILLEQITHQNYTDEATKPILVSSIDHKEKFNAIDPAIRRYLSNKKKNYYKAPNFIPNKDTLHGYVSKCAPPSLEHIENRFLELQKPIIFLSTPQSGLINDETTLELKKATIQNIIHNLKKEFQDFQIRYEDTGLTNAKEIIHPFNNLRLLQQTRYFIIILTKTDKASFSLIQLGWAIAYCKYVLIIYEDGAISERLKALEKISANIQRIKISNIAEEQEKICQEISFFILSHKLDKNKIEL